MSGGHLMTSFSTAFFLERVGINQRAKTNSLAKYLLKLEMRNAKPATAVSGQVASPEIRLP